MDRPTIGVFFMAKYDERFKLKVVKQYLAGKGGFRQVSQVYGLDMATVRRWVAHYQLHGKAGLARKYSHYSVAFKMKVLKHMWRQELSYHQVAALFDLRSGSVVSRWEHQYHAGGEEALVSKPRGRPPKMPTSPPSPAKPTPTVPDDTRSREELLEELKQLRAEVDYLKKVEALIQAHASAAPKKRK